MEAKNAQEVTGDPRLHAMKLHLVGMEETYRVPGGEEDIQVVVSLIGHPQRIWTYIQDWSWHYHEDGSFEVREETRKEHPSLEAARAYAAIQWNIERLEQGIK